MKKFWQKISVRIDSRTLRERAMLFGMIAALIIFLIFFFILTPSYLKQKQMLGEMGQQQERIAAVEAEIAQTIEARARDPDLAERSRLQQVQAQSLALKQTLADKQQGMVPAERMNALLEQILRAHRGLRLVSMRTLAESDATPAAAPAAAPVAWWGREGRRPGRGRPRPRPAAPAIAGVAS